MRFFIPGANDPRQAEEHFQAIRTRLADQAGALEPKRLYSLRFRDGDQIRTLSVGQSMHESGGRPVAAIFKTGDEFFICTGIAGGVDDQPVRVPADAVLSTEEFTAFA